MVRKHSGLKHLTELAEDSEAVVRAVKAVENAGGDQEEHQTVPSPSEVYPGEQGPMKACEGQSIEQSDRAVPDKVQRSGLDVPSLDLADQTIDLGVAVCSPTGRPTPLYPPGIVYWILNSGAKPQSSGSSDLVVGEAPSMEQ